MNKAKRCQILADSGRNVFSNADLSMLWGTDVVLTKILASRLSGEGLLHRLARGIYTYKKEVSLFELANRLVTPSYISCHSALFEAGVSFQESSLMTSVALVNITKRIEKRTFKYYCMKAALFFVPAGIADKGNFMIAEPERALLDSFYFGLLPSVDHAEKLNPKILEDLLSFYPKTVCKKAKRLMEAHRL